MFSPCSPVSRRLIVSMAASAKGRFHGRFPGHHLAQRLSYILLLLVGPFAKIMITKSLKLNLRLTQYHLKYWNWPRATGLPRVGEGRGGPPEEVIEPTIFSVLKQLCS